jgi:hypothetical protein
VSSTRAGNADLNISLNNGISWCQLPGLNRAINPLQDSIVVFTVPDSILDNNAMVSTISNGCLLQLIDYGNKNFVDYSDSTFSIVESK